MTMTPACVACTQYLLPCTATDNGIHPAFVHQFAQDATPFCGTHHRWPDDIAGYAIALTKSGHGRIRDLAIYDTPNRYGDVVELAREIREILEAGHYARIDVLYNDGCRAIL